MAMMPGLPAPTMPPTMAMMPGLPVPTMPPTMAMMPGLPAPTMPPTMAMMPDATNMDGAATMPHMDDGSMTPPGMNGADMTPPEWGPAHTGKEADAAGDAPIKEEDANMGPAHTGDEDGYNTDVEEWKPEWGTKPDFMPKGGDTFTHHGGIVYGGP